MAIKSFNGKQVSRPLRRHTSSCWSTFQLRARRRRLQEASGLAAAPSSDWHIFYDNNNVHSFHLLLLLAWSCRWVLLLFQEKALEKETPRTSLLHLECGIKSISYNWLWPTTQSCRRRPHMFELTSAGEIQSQLQFFLTTTEQCNCRSASYYMAICKVPAWKFVLTENYDLICWLWLVKSILETPMISRHDHSSTPATTSRSNSHNITIISFS